LTLASTKSLANQPIRGLPLLGLIWLNKFTNSSQKGLLYVQVNCKYFVVILQVEITSAVCWWNYKLFSSAFECSYKCSICLYSVILTVKLFRQ
jgi:hypothetical protein